ncbi:MAG: hypothetical protein EBT92_13810, partial [Planctomycetes bacterium]|nr:hypothetical protein [Planctomycetota bacterium]
RKPLYIECNENGVLLFPDKMLFPSNDESENLKNELLTRTSQLRDYLLQTLGPKDATPYLMILVRPGGITNYWKLQSVIKPMEIDFGYELVDKIWSLEIPIEQSAPSPSKLASLVKPTQIPKPIPAPGNIRGGINNGNGSIPQQNNAAENNGIYQSGNDKTYGSKENSKSISYGATAQNIRPLTALPGFPGNKESLNNLAINNQIIGTNTKGSGLANNNLYGSGMTKNNSNGSGLQNNATDEPRNPTDRNLNESYGNNKKSNNSSDSTNSRNGNSLDNESKVQLNEQNNEKENSLTISNGRNFGNPNRNDLNRTDKESSGGSYSTNTKNNESGGASDTKGPYSASTKPNSFSEKPLNYQKGNGLGSTGDEKESSNKKNLSGNPGAQDTEPNSTSKKETTNSIGGSNNQNTQTPIQNQNISISLNNKNKDEANVTTKQMTPRTTYNREDESQSQSDAQDATARIAAPLPELGPRKTQNPTPLRAARLFADRDWVIFVECKFEEILVHPNRLVIPTSLLASEEGVKRFVQEIEKIIQRKQSTVRPGEPPYRPEVRFLVWPDGLKPYHLSYPALQMAGIKQKRQNLEPEDNIKEIIQGR